MSICGTKLITYTSNNLTLSESLVEKDFGVLTLYNFKSIANCNKNTFRANFALLTVKRIFGQFDSRIFHIIFSSFTRFCLEYGNILFPSLLWKDSNTMERTQRKATKSVRGLKFKSYEEHLLIPEYRRPRGDLIMANKIPNTPEDPLEHLLRMNSNTS